MSAHPVPSPSRRSLFLGAAASIPLVGLGAASAGAYGGFRDAAGLTMIDGSPWVHRDIRSIDFRFDTGGQVKTFPPSVRVTLPVGYEDHPDRHYPVLLLLHGGMGYYLDWSEWGNVIEATAPHDVITVMPDGGAGSFYSNANAPAPGKEANWETFIMEQVLGFVHENFRTDAGRMAIAGLSMGGWGALALGQRYWGHFRSISSYSGPADCSTRTLGSHGVAAVLWAAPLGDAVKYGLNANGVGATWGLDPFPAIADGYNPMENIETYRGKRLFLRTGDGGGLGEFYRHPDILQGITLQLDRFGMDVQEVGVRETNDSFHHALSDAGIDHDYRVLPGRTHEPGLWRENLAEDLPGMMATLNA